MMTRTKRKTREKTTNGSRLAGLVLALVLMLVYPAAAEKKPKKQNDASQPYALITGTVYRPPGFAMAGAEVEIIPEAESKVKKTKLISDARGEFALRVPPVPSKYTVDVKRNGYQSQQQTVSIEGEQRKELTFQLEPAVK